jgi:energy-coupling factor transporter ATP-binding protein EcfA2
MTLLAARDLAVIPPGAAAPATPEVSLTIDRGDWVAITGPNGGGKSSFLLGLAGLWPAHGTLELHGRGFGPQSGRELRSRVGVVLQDPSSQMLQSSVRDELAFGPLNAGLDEGASAARVERWARCLGLESDLDRDPATLSAGRQQLVALGAALAAEPELLLADEPTAHLDPVARARVLEVIRSRVAEGLAVVWVTQLEEEAGAARRRIEIGAPAALEGTEGPPVRSDVPLLRIGIEPPAAGEGPMIQVDRPTEVVVWDRGVTALTGRNGVGKSVLLWAVSGLGAVGQVSLEWLVDPVPPPIAALQFPELQIFEEHPETSSSMPPCSRPDRQTALDRGRDFMDRLGMPLEGHEQPADLALAAGEKRILEVVAALIAPACLLVLDEPTAGLDPPRRAALGALVRKVSEDRPVLVATQDRAWAEDVAASIRAIGAV